MTDPIRAASIRALFVQVRGSTVPSIIVTLYLVAASWSFKLRSTSGWPELV